MSEVTQPFSGRDVSHPAAVDPRRLEGRSTDARAALQAMRIPVLPGRDVRVLLGPPSNDRVVVGTRADDRAGVAVILELAHVLAAAPPNGCVELVVYADSAAHARVLKSEDVHVRAMLALARPDAAWIVGRLGGERLVQATKRAMAGATPLGVHALVAPRRWLDAADAASYWDEGDEAVRVGALSPRATEPLDWARVAHVTEGLASTIVALARP